MGRVLSVIWLQFLFWMKILQILAPLCGLLFFFLSFSDVFWQTEVLDSNVDQFIHFFLILLLIRAIWS